MTCVRTGREHAMTLLGKEDDGRFVHRCGNCGLIGHSMAEVMPIQIDEEEGGGSDLTRTIPALSVAAKG